MCLVLEAFIKVPGEKLYGIQVAPLHDDKPFESRWLIKNGFGWGFPVSQLYLPTAAFN